MEFMKYVEVIANLGVAVTMSVAFVWFVIKVMPKRDKEFLAALTSQRKDHGEEVKLARKDFRDETKEAREAHERDLDRMFNSGRGR